MDIYTVNAPAFCYYWRNSSNDMLYVGYHKGTEDDGYVCSSRMMLKYYKEHPEYFERTIIARGTHREMIDLEYNILSWLDAKNNPCYYNKANGGGTDKDVHRYKRGPEERLKISMSLRGRVFTPEHLAKISASLKGKRKTLEQRAAQCGAGNPMFGKKASEETRAKMRGPRGKNKNSDNKKGARNHFYGRKHSQETIDKISATKKGKKITPEQLAKRLTMYASKEYSDKIKAKKRTPEYRSKISKILKGKPKSVEHIENLRIAALNRKPFSVEEQARITAKRIATKKFRAAFKAFDPSI